MTSFFIVSQLMKESSDVSGNLMRKSSGWRSMPFYSTQPLLNTKILPDTDRDFLSFCADIMQLLNLSPSSFFYPKNDLATPEKRSISTNILIYYNSK